MTSFWNGLAQQISTAIGRSCIIRQCERLGGGCINQAWKISDGGYPFFVKTNTATGVSMFEAEAAGLVELAATATVRVPTPICYGAIADRAYLVLEYLPLGDCGISAMESLGRNLAAMHRLQQPWYGWHRNNTIGLTHQPNERRSHWVSFWREQRLGFQLALARKNGSSRTLQQHGEQLLVRLDELFEGHRFTPALLHGDLWGGNVGCTIDGEPVIFDPAVYYGDREADLAMTELFGGFSSVFYAAYRESFPLEAGYPQRRILYNIYHILNHFNLFGGHYGAQAERMIARLLAELR